MVRFILFDPLKGGNGAMPAKQNDIYIHRLYVIISQTASSMVYMLYF